MASNKHAVIRYQALDKCFSNPYRKFYIDDLLDACNVALKASDPKTEGIRKRQLYEDIKFMKSPEGFSIELKELKGIKEKYYRYDDPNFSINKKGLNQAEASHVKQALLILSRFKGTPQFEWVDEAIAKFESAFGLKKGAEKVIAFDENKDYTAVQYISKLFNSILYEQVLSVTYKSFRQENESCFIFHPYYLKQYNNRWFCFGLNDELDKIMNLALDRIVEIQDHKLKFKSNTTVNFDDYFEDVIGVTVQGEVELVTLKVDNDLWPYIFSKPLHGTQKIKSKNNDAVTITIEVKLNYELEALILSHGNRIQVITPLSLREKIENRSIRKRDT